MKCNECLKELNEMTLYCDRCGAQVAKEKMNLSFKIIEENVVPLHIECDYKEDHIEDIKKAYFLSNIRKDFKGFKKRYIDQYIDYVLLRTYYEKNKVLLTTEDFNKEKAIALLESFLYKKPDPLVFEILKEEYVEDYENKVIPRSITDKIENIYCTDFNLRILNPSRFASKILMTTIIGVIRIGIILGVLITAAYVVTPMFVPDFDVLGLFTRIPYLSFGIGALVLVLGYLTSKKKRLYYPFADIINHNTEFSKHIKQVMKKRIKTLKYRMKKESKNKKK